MKQKLSQQDSLDWVPHVSVNGFRFEESFNAINERAFVEFELSVEGVPGDCSGWDHYQCGDMDLSFQDGVLFSVAFEDRCILNGIDLIGRPVEDTIESLVEHARPLVQDSIRIEKDPTKYELDEPQYCYGIDGAGVHVWASAETGLVVDISFFKNDEDEDAQLTS